MLALWISLALAGPGFYHPDDIATASARFTEASKVAGGTFEARSRAAEDVAGALADYQLALDVLGDRAPAGERSRLAELDKAYAREVAILDRFAAAMMDDFDKEFSAALDRALKAHPGAKECAAEVPMGRPLPGLPSRTEKNPACVGDNLNAPIASSIDADPELSTAVKEILVLKWPAITAEAAPQAAIGGGTRWADPAALLSALAKPGLAKIDRDDAAGRDEFAAAIEAGLSVAAKKQLLVNAQALTAETARRRAAFAAPALVAADAAAAKWAKKGEPITGWCSNPAALGGCTGEDATLSLVPRWLAVPKVQKAVDGWAAPRAPGG